VRYLIVEPVLSVQRAEVIHGEDVAFVVDTECPHQSGARGALEGLDEVLHHHFPVKPRHGQWDRRHTQNKRSVSIQCSFWVFFQELEFAHIPPKEKGGIVRILLQVKSSF